MMTLLRCRWAGSTPVVALALALIASCGGRVVVDTELDSIESKGRAICESYCELARGVYEACGRDSCLYWCLDDLAFAEEQGCLEEWIPILECRFEGLKNTGFCEGGCVGAGDLFRPYNECRARNGYGGE